MELILELVVRNIRPSRRITPKLALVCRRLARVIDDLPRTKPNTFGGCEILGAKHGWFAFSRNIVAIGTTTYKQYAYGRRLRTILFSDCGNLCQITVQTRRDTITVDRHTISAHDRHKCIGRTSSMYHGEHPAVLDKICMRTFGLTVKDIQAINQPN